MVIELDKLGEYDELIVHILVKKNTKIDFEKSNCLMLSTSPITKEESAVHIANYLGNGKWCSLKKTSLKKVTQ